MAFLGARLRWALWGFSGLLSLLLIALLHTPPARRYALKQLVQILDKQGVTFETSQFDYNLLALKADLSNVVVRSAQTPHLPPVLRADQVHVDMDLRKLLSGEYRIEDASVRNPQVHLVFDKDGKSNIPEIPESEKKQDSQSRFLVDKLVITGADLRVEERRQNVSAHLPPR